MLRFSRLSRAKKAISAAGQGLSADSGSIRGVWTGTSMVGRVRVEGGSECSRVPRYLLLALLGSVGTAFGPIDSKSDTNALYAHCHADNNNNKEPTVEKKLTKEELIKELKEKLTECRYRLQKEHKHKQQYPHLYVKSSDNSTHEIILYSKWPYQDGNYFSLMKRWMNVLKKSNNTHSNGIHTTFSPPNLDQKVMKYISETNPNNFISIEPDSISITKDSYSSQDIDEVVAGYEKFHAHSAGDLSDNILGDLVRSRDIFSELYESNDVVRASPKRKSQSGESTKDDPIKQLKSMGIDVNISTDLPESDRLNWDSLAGYDDLKLEIMSTIVNALQHPGIYDNIAKQTRERYESNRPTAILFDGSPGTGKTLTARILASQCNRPLIVLKLESFVSKWYGDSEKKLAEILSLCNKVPGGAILFIDEIDSMVTSRDSGNMHEVTRRILSTLLTHMEGFDGKHSSNNQSLLICATNRKQDLDSALLSRFGATIYYPLPNVSSRIQIIKRYAKQLSVAEIEKLAVVSSGLSCRDLKEACEQTERLYAGSLIKLNINDNSLPACNDYIPNLTSKRNNPSNYNA